jgi:DeoR/GlpR family transcriptional regulator of sugar metabolism
MGTARISEHQTRHRIAYATARSDLLKLAEHELLEKHMRGRAFIFTAPHDLLTRLKSACKNKKVSGDNNKQPTLFAS